MADTQKFVELIENSAGAFAADPPDRELLTPILSGLNLFLVDTDGLPFQVVDNVWQGAKKLRAALAEDALNIDLLSECFEQLASAVDALDSKEEKSDKTTEEVIEEYTIPDDDVPLIEDFITEATEHIEAAEAAMLDLEAHVEDADTLNLIFRSFHTIKGMAGFMNLTQVGALSHDAENLLDLARKGERILSGANADAIFKAIDMLKTMVGTIRESISTDNIIKPVAGVSELVDFIRACADGTAQTSEPTKEEPAAEAPAKAAPTEQETPSSENTAPPAAVPAKEEEKENTATAIAAAAAQASQQHKKNTTHIDEKIKVSTSRLDSLVNMVGELVIAQLMVSESLKANLAADNELMRNTMHQSKIIRELQELSMSMRMVPISGVFQKMARMIRDLSRTAEKQIHFNMLGEQTELDRTIVDKLADPLIHMIRNSVDHGIEPPEERRKAGKKKTGRVELRAFHLAGNIVIEIEDDGRGLNRKKLLDKAISRGVITPEKNMSDSDVLSLIFHPGLSTAEKVTSVSGRGVGMDVVKRNIEELRGRIDIISKEGQGTTFTITLPLTLAIIDGQVVRIGNEKYIIPINAITKSFRPTKEQVSTIQGRSEMIMEREKIYPLVRLHNQFGVEPDNEDPADGLVVLVEEDNQACCLLVDELLDQQQVVIKSLGDIFRGTEGISGGAIMGNGLVSLILDIPGIIKHCKV